MFQFIAFYYTKLQYFFLRPLILAGDDWDTPSFVAGGFPNKISKVRNVFWCFLGLSLDYYPPLGLRGFYPNFSKWLYLSIIDVLTSLLKA